MFQVCEICGDAGFADCLYICKQCKGAEHLYCMPVQPDSDGEACWTCEICMLKQKTTQGGTVASSLYSELEPSQEQLSEFLGECQDSHPTIKKQASECSDATDSPNKKREPDKFDGTKSLPASKKKAIESSNETDSLPKHKEKMLRNSSGIEILFINKKQNTESCNGIDSSNNSKQALNSSNCTDFFRSTKKQVLKNSDGPYFPDFSLIRNKQVVEKSDGSYSLPSDKKQEIEISKVTDSFPVSKKQELQNPNCIDSLQGSKKQSPKCFSRTDSLLINKKEVVKSSYGADSPPAIEKQSPESSKDTRSLPASKMQPLGSVNCTNSISVGKKRVLENSKGTDSLPASKKQLLRSCSGVDSLPGRKKQATKSLNDTDCSKESSENRPSLRQSPVLEAQVIPALVSSGSKSATVDKSFDSSCPNTLDSAKTSLRSSKEIGSKNEQSSLNRKLSKSKVAVECGMELKKFVPADSIRVSELNKDGLRSANKVSDKHNDSKMPESLSPMEVDLSEFSSGLIAKGDSSGYDVISAGVTNNHKERDQSLIGKSTVEDTMTVNERDYEIDNRGSGKNSISQVTDKGKLDVNVDSWNNHSLRSHNEYDKEKMGHSMIHFSEINVPSSSELENQSLNTCGRDFIAQNTPSCTHFSSVTSPPRQLQLAVPQSLILWKGTFNVDIGIGHAIYDGIQAHPSTTASLKVYEMSKQFGSQLYLEQVHRAEAWPKRFEQSPPTDDNVGLYFFPEDGKSERSFATLVEYINKHDLAMRMHLDGADLLIFSSIQLPKYVQRIFGKFYLWGVFRRAEKSTTGHKLCEASIQHDHVRGGMADLVAPSRSNNSDSVICVEGFQNVHKNGVKEEMDFDMEGGKDAAVSERPLRSMDSQSAGFPPVCISPLSLPLGSDHFQASGIKGYDANTSGCALYGQDLSLPRIRSKVNSENFSEEASRRYSGKLIDQSHQWYHCSGIEKIDGQSEFNLLDHHILPGHYPGKSPESMHARSDDHKSHEESNIGESTPRIGASNRIHILEEKDENELLTLQPQSTNIKPGFVPTACPTDHKSQPSLSNHLHEKQGFMHSQVQSNANAGAKKQNDPRDGHHNSHQSSLSAGDSDCSNGNKGRSLSQPTSQRKIYKHEDINRFSRSHSFRDHIGTQTKSCNGDDRSKEDTKVVVERYRERSHRHWQPMDVRTHALTENHRGCKEIILKHQRTEDGRRHKQMENRRSPVINNRVNSSDSCSNKGDMLEETSVHKDFSSSSHEKTSNHRWSSNNHQNQVKNCVDKDKVYMVDNFNSVKMDCSVTELEEASDQYQVVKDQQSFTPLRTGTDETVENNTVSEISNAASSLESPGQIYAEEIGPRLLEADLPGKVNSRTEHMTQFALDQKPLLSHGNWYAASSPSEVDQEPVECLKLFPLEEENLGVTKNIVKELEDINLDLCLGRGIVKTTLKLVDKQVCPDRSNLEGTDVNPCLGVSLPLEKRKETYT